MRTHTVITIRLDDGCKSDPAGRLCQYDYGQRIQFVGVTLPASYEVHFSNQKQGRSVTMIGDETGVEIPDAVLLTGQDVHVWLYLHQGADDGETVYYARIAVENRAEPTHEEPTPVQQSEIEQAIAALNAAVETTGEAAATATAAAAAAGASQDAAEDAKDLAEAAAETAESAKEAAAASEDAAADSRDRAETAADAAETSAGTAEDAKTLAVAAQAAAEGSADAAAGSATAASGAASTAGTYALKSEGYAVGKQNGEPVGQESPYYHGNAAYYAGEAEISAQTASGKAGEAASSANTASGAAGTATAAAASATSAKTAAETAQGKAEAAQTAAEAAQTAAEAARDAALNMIDDTAGAGDTTKVWSADKSSSELSGVLSAIDGKAPVILQTASGDIVTFADGAENMPLSSCVVQIDPVQASGTPSPENPLSISGWTGCNISQSGADTSDPTVYAITFPTAAGTVYGGTLDALTGVLTVTMGYTQYTAAQFSAYPADCGYSNSMSVFGGAPGVWFRNYLNSYGIAGRRAGGVRALCNAFPIACNNTSISSSQNRSAFRVDGTTINSMETFIAAVQTLENNGGGLYIAFELATPLTYQLDPVQITTLMGENLWADTGAISLTYPADTKAYIDAATDPDGNVVTVTGSTPAITGESGKRYICGTVDSISITPPSTGIIDVVFTSGTTPTVLTVPNTVRFPAWFNPASLDASTKYEINIMDGTDGAVMAWPT